MAGHDFTGQNIEDTYQRVVQVSGSTNVPLNGTGSQLTSLEVTASHANFAATASHLTGAITSASYSDTAVSASYAPTPAGVISGSAQIATEISGAFTAPSSSISTRITDLENAPTGQYITTGSDDQSVQDINGSLKLTGDIIAENYIVSSSVLYQTQSYSSGSTIFGNDSEDIHEFTGSVNVSGSVSITDNLEVGDMGFEGVGIDVNGVIYSSSFKVSDINGTNWAQTILHRHSTILEPLILGARANSETAAHVSMSAGQNVFTIVGVGYTGNHYDQMGQINIGVGDEGVNPQSSPGKITFKLTKSGSQTPTTALTLDSDHTAIFSHVVSASTFSGSHVGDGSQLTGLVTAAAVSSSFVLKSAVSGAFTEASNSIADEINSLQDDVSDHSTRIGGIENVTGSYATTASNHFNGDQTITGSLTVSGSSKFGNRITDTHKFTGSLQVSGNIEAGNMGFEKAGININGVTYSSSFKVSDIDGTNWAQTILHRHSTILEPLILGARANSDTAAHVAVTANQNVFTLLGAGYTGTHYDQFGQINIAVGDEGVTPNSSPGKMLFKLVKSGSQTPTTALTIDSDHHANFSAAVTASAFTGSFVGDGSQLTGLSAGIFVLTGSKQNTTNDIEITGSLWASSITGSIHSSSIENFDTEVSRSTAAAGFVGDTIVNQVKIFTWYNGLT